jgi:hypothetical protein
MGEQYSAQCLDCGKKFDFCDGGGFLFYLARRRLENNGRVFHLIFTSEGMKTTRNLKL